MRTSTLALTALIVFTLPAATDTVALPKSATKVTAELAQDPCNGIGCKERDENENLGVNDSDPNCIVSIKRETSGFQETCGDEADNCDTATCSYTWKIVYRTVGPCTGSSFDIYEDETLYEEDLPPSAVPSEIDQGTYGPKRCGKMDDDYNYSIMFHTSTTPLATIQGDGGCQDCE